MAKQKTAYVKEFYRGDIKWIGIYINGLCNSMYEALNESHIIKYEETLRGLRLMNYKIVEWDE